MAVETDDTGRPISDKRLAVLTEEAETFMFETWGIPKPPPAWRDQDWGHDPRAEDRAG